MMFSGKERITSKEMTFNSLCFFDPKYVYCKKKFLNISCSLDLNFVHKKFLKMPAFSSVFSVSSGWECPAEVCHSSHNSEVCVELWTSRGFPKSGLCNIQSMSDCPQVK